MTKFYSVQNTPNTVSADRDPSERGFLGTVIQSGKPLIDYEFQLFWDIQSNLQSQIRRLQFPSGVLKSNARRGSYQDFSFDLPTDPGFVANAFHMSRLTALVAGIPVMVEYTDTSTPLDNVIQLDAPPILGGGAPDTKRTDFVFLEVWLSLVGPSPRAQSSITVASLPNDGDIVTLNGNPLTARGAGAPGVDEFIIGGDVYLTAASIMAAVNSGVNSYSGDMVASLNLAGDAVVLTAVAPGAVGNALTLATSVPAVLVIPGGVFVGGADRPNKPSQTTLYRHGNTQADSAVNVADDLADPLVVVESAQRIQVQYRIRVTGQTEAVNFQIQPDGFSNPNILAQGGEVAPVATYFFLPADGITAAGGSDASTYPNVDAGLWIAGDGTSASATALQTLDGYVYAIPLAMVFRRNDAYLGGAGAGFDPVNNTNGALPSTHALFANPFVGSIAIDTSDRPDNAFSDAINENDVLDLRRHVLTSGVDLQSELQWQMQSLLDGENRTWAIDSSDKQTLGSASGDVSTRFLVANEIGRDSGHGGNNVTSGDTSRGVTIRNFDHVARRFGDQPVVERVVFALLPQDRDVGPVVAPAVVNPGKYVERAVGTDVGWFEGDIIHVDLGALNASTDGSFDPATASLAVALENVEDFMPPGTLITDVLSVFHDDGNHSSAVDQSVQVAAIQGLGTTHVTVTLDENPSAVSGGLAITSYATCTIQFASNPLPGTTVTIDGLPLTAVVGPPGANQFTIGATAADTFQDFFENAVPPTVITPVLRVGASGTFRADAIGAGGNAITLSTSHALVVLFSGPTLANGVTGVTVSPMVGTVGLGDVGSPRRVFIELEVTYPKGNGLTDTPDFPLTPDATNYAAGPVLENDIAQRPADMEGLIAPQFREGFRETSLEYIASENGAGSPIGGIVTEQFVSRSATELVFPRRVYGSAIQLVNVTDAVAAAPAAVDTASTEYGSSSRKVVLGGALSGPQTLCTVTYFAQDPLPNYGGAGGGYQTTIYFRSNAPQTVGVKSGVMSGGGGPLPKNLVVEPLLMSQKLWAGQTGVGSLDASFPFGLPLDQIPVNEGLGSFPGEWFFCATSEISISDFNANTGLLSLPALVPAAENVTFSFGSALYPPDKDIEFRAFYGFADDTAYRPTMMSQPLSGSVRHKVFTPFLARAAEDTLLFRKNEILLLVLTRWAELDAQNTVLFTDTDNRTCVGVYRTRNLLVLAGD